MSFHILADECEDISTKEEVTICFRWIRNGKPKEYFVNMLQVKALDAATITVLLWNLIRSILEK